MYYSISFCDPMKILQHYNITKGLRLQN